MIENALAKTLGSYRAENLDTRTLFELYTAPSYFPELLQPIPCFLQGGRGTGKTTVLRFLSYESEITAKSTNGKPFHGLYIKFERSEISAFSGGGFDEQFWTKPFAHYMNLRQTLALIEYVATTYSSTIHTVDQTHFDRFLRSLGIPNGQSLSGASDSLHNAIIDLQRAVNVIQDEPHVELSTLAVPTRHLVRACSSLPDFTLRPVAFLFDEYEILEDYQQRIVNTLVKQADHTVTYKIGVREEGLRERLVMESGEEIRTPADYALINIEDRLTEGSFNKFASQVVLARLKPLRDQGYEVAESLEALFPGLTIEAEAGLLGVGATAEEIRKSNPFLADRLKVATDFDVFFADFIARSRGAKISDVLRGIENHGRTCRNLRNNYDYASLFTLKRKHPGLTKYYCGWQTLLALANGNIRYLLQIVSKTLLEHVREGSKLTDAVPPRRQTECCESVAQEIFRDCEGISLSGAKLTKLVLALGQVFHQLAVTPEGHAPEITQFELSDEDTATLEELAAIRPLLRDAVMHLALVRIGGTKLGGAADTRTYDYMLHPIFSAFFRYSHRRKRKMGLSAAEVTGLIEDPKRTIQQILERHNRSSLAYVPDQLQLFGGFRETGQ